MAARTLKASLAFVAIALLMQGCAVGFGKPYEVVFQNSSSVTVVFDPLLAGIGTVAGAAQSYCATLGKDAVPRMVSDGGAVRQASFDCRVREIARPPK